MIVEGLMSVVGGGLLRLIPNVLDFFKARREMSHELEMRKEEIKFEIAKLDKQMEIREQEIDAEQTIKGIEALIEATRAQGAAPTATGNKFLDFASGWVYVLSQSVRPIVTYWWVIVLYTAYKVALYVTYVDNNMAWNQAVVDLWTESDAGIMGSIIGFWFLDRVLPRDKR